MKASDLRSGRRLLSDPPVARDATAGFGLRLDENGAIPGRLAIPSPASIASGETAVWNGTQYVRSSVTKIANTSLAGYPFAPTSYRKTTAKVVNTTVSPTDLLNAEITVAGNAIGATGMLRLTAFGDWKQNSGGTAVPPRFQLILGGTTIFDTGTSGTVGTNLATRLGWRLSFDVFNTATNAQVAYASGSLYCPTTTAGSTAFTTGEGTYATFIISSAGLAVLTGYNTSALDTTTSKTLVLNVINGSANANYETKLSGALVEIL